jgi:hypothetical protein
MRPPPDPRASSTFSLSLLPCQSIYLESLHEIHLRSPISSIAMRRQIDAAKEIMRPARFALHQTSNI